MKKLLILLLALTAIVWAEIKIEMPVRIEYLPEKWFDVGDFEIDDKWKEFCAELDKSGCHIYEDILCPTVLELNILYGWPNIEGTVEFYVLTGATHSWREVFENQLNHYRRCGMMAVDDSSYNSLLAKIDSVLVPEIEKYQQSNGMYSKALIFDYSQGIMRDFDVGGPPDYEFGKYALDSVKARNAAISPLAPSVFRLESVRVQDHQLIVPPKLIGRQFTLFDVNGHELRRGTLQNNMLLPAYPTVIKIQGFGTKVLK